MSPEVVGLVLQMVGLLSIPGFSTKNSPWYKPVMTLEPTTSTTNPPPTQMVIVAFGCSATTTWSADHYANAPDANG